ncbi:DUF4184 family protein [Jannaschia sp. R86511]|uniref:DUF4184 family protein n=1 Tax=Jannaschia sp. R86511 TaxID=3093853 RepID=UPI0036D2C8EC
MPFTLAHPAAVLPLMRGPLVPTALVAGAVSPDLPYFLRATGIPVTAQSWYEPLTNATTTHSLPGLLTVAVPLALLLHLGLRAALAPLATLGPAPAHAAAAGARSRGGRPGLGRGVAVVGWVALSLVLGVLTHVVWDSFTHGDGWVVQQVPALSDPVLGRLTWARALQHASTVVGLSVLLVHLWRRRGRLLPRPGTAARARLARVAVLAVVVAAAGAVVTTRGWWGADATTGVLVEGLLSDGAKGAGAAVAGVAAVGVAAWWVLHLPGVARVRPARGASGGGPDVRSLDR